MALTRPTVQNINTNLTTFSDSLTVTNFGNVANRDIGEVFDRSQGGGSNVAIFWQESTSSFAVAYTSSTGKEAGNLTVTQYADLIASNITANNLIVSNIVYQSSEFVSTTEVVAGNSTVNGLTVNNSATIGTTLGVAGNITSTNIAPSANVTYDLGSPTKRFKSLYLSGNTIYMDDATISSNATAITFTNPSGGSFTISGSNTFVASSASATAQYVTGNAQANITSVGTLSGLTLSGATTGTTFYGANFGNNGANFTGNVFSALSLQTESVTVTNTAQLLGPVSISSIGNLSIPGGFSGYVLKTDGAGNLAWQGAGGITYTANTAPPIAGNLTGDQWYNTSTDVLYEYSFDGASYYWVDQSGAAFGNAPNAAPAFGAYANSAAQSIPTDVQTKVLFQTEEYDTHNCFANSRFTPTSAGFYQLNSQVRFDGTSGTGEMMIVIWKNGSEYKRGTNQRGTEIASLFWAQQVSSLVYANGTTDYFEIYVQHGAGANRSITAVNNPAITWFNGCMMRGA